MINILLHISLCNIFLYLKLPFILFFDFAFTFVHVEILVFTEISCKQ